MRPGLRASGVATHAARAAEFLAGWVPDPDTKSSGKSFSLGEALDFLGLRGPEKFKPYTSNHLKLRSNSASIS